jgi:hypothetical protein
MSGYAAAARPPITAATRVGSPAGWMPESRPAQPGLVPVPVDTLGRDWRAISDNEPRRGAGAAGCGLTSRARSPGRDHHQHRGPTLTAAGLWTPAGRDRGRPATHVLPARS